MDIRFIAIVSQKPATITCYDSQGANFSSANCTVYYSSVEGYAPNGDYFGQITIPNNGGYLSAPAITGFQFEGWFTIDHDVTVSDADFSGIRLSLATEILSNDASGRINIDTVSTAHTLTDRLGGRYYLVYPKWKVAEYIVTFDPNQGDMPETEKTRTVVYNHAVGQLPVPTREGHTFEGWFTSATGGTKISESTVITSAKTFYAHWTPLKYPLQITVNGNIESISASYTSGGAETSDTFTASAAVDVDFGTAWTASAVAATGYVASPATGGGNMGTDGDAFAPTAVAKTSALTFKANGGTGTMSTGKVAIFGESMPTPVNLPTRTGYDFSGFFDAATGGTQYYGNTGASARAWDKDSTAPTTLYAQWEAHAYTVTRLPGYSGGGSLPGVSAVYDEPFESTVPPDRTGYYFTGWCVTRGLNTATAMFGPTAASAISRITSATQLCYNGYPSSSVYFANLTSDPNGAATLTAQWEARTFEVMFDADGGSVSPSSKTVTYDSPYGDLPIPQKQGFVFAGWWTDASGGSQVLSSSYCFTASDHTLFARWSIKTSEVLFDKQGGSGGTSVVTAQYGSPMPDITIPSREGFGFSGYFDQVNGGGSKYYDSTGTGVRNWDKEEDDVTLFALWTPHEYSVVFHANGGTGTMAAENFQYGESKALTSNAFIRTGFSFSGWATESAGAVTYTDGQSVSNLTAVDGGQVNLYAVWIEITYTATVEPGDGGTGSHSYVYALGSAQQTIAIELPTRTGFSISGWTFSGYSGSSPSITGNVLLIPAGTTGDFLATPSWKVNSYPLAITTNAHISSISVTYTFGGETKTETKTDTTTVLVDFGTEWAASATAASGYRASPSSASGWMGLGGAAFSPEAIANEYTVFFNADGGSTPTPSKTVTYASEYGALPIPTRLGHSFGGWWTEVGGLGVQVIETTPVTITDDQTLYAKWTVNTCIVSVSPMPPTGGEVYVNGEAAVSAVELPFGSRVVLRAEPSTEFEFSNWTDSTGTEISQSPEYEFSLEGDITNFANFVPTGESSSEDSGESSSEDSSEESSEDSGESSSEDSSEESFLPKIRRRRVPRTAARVLPKIRRRRVPRTAARVRRNPSPLSMSFSLTT